MAIKVQEGFRNLNTGLILLLPVAALSLMGLVVLMSAGQSFISTDSLFVFRRQLIWLAIAASAGVATMFVDLEKLRKFAWPIAIVSIVLLVLVLAPGVGVKIKGARRWLDFGPFRCQPSEFAKLALVFVLSHYLATNHRELRTLFKGFIFPCAIIGCFAAFIILEPDFGTTVLCGSVGCVLLFLSGVRLLFLLPSLLLSASLFSVAVYLDPVRLSRVTSFLNVEAYRSGESYQLWQGILAFAAGGWDGVGLGNGRQQIYFLPEAHTDFVLAVIGEELGLIFTVVVALLFLSIFLIVVWHLRKAPNLFQFLLATGATLMIVLQSLINMGVVTGLLPTKGMSLPYISYGGSNLVVMFMLTGVIFNCLRVPFPNLASYECFRYLLWWNRGASSSWYFSG